MVLKASYSCGAVKYLHFNTRKFHNFSPNSWKVINLQTQFETVLELFAAYCKLILITTSRHLNFTCIQHHSFTSRYPFHFLLCCNSICHLLKKKKKKIATNSKANSRAFNASSKLPPPPPPLKLRMVCMSNSIWPIYLLAHYLPPPPFTKEGEKKEGNVTVTSV